MQTREKRDWTREPSITVDAHSGVAPENAPQTTREVRKRNKWYSLCKKTKHHATTTETLDIPTISVSCTLNE
eukprot:scaffold34685_cov183-Amphora_coffeaeformis.AAC.32